MCCTVEIEGKELKVANEQESWGIAQFWDGKKVKKVRYRVVLVGVKKTKTGDYAFRSAVIYDYGQLAIKASKTPKTGQK